MDFRFIKRIVLVALLFAMGTPVLGQKSTGWTAPQAANNIKNPQKGDQVAITEGKKLFSTMCAVCHGTKGKGDGVAGMNLKPRPTNLTATAVQSQSDGAIYWKITEGKAPMAAYKATLSEKQRWQLVDYIRTLSK